MVDQFYIYYLGVKFLSTNVKNNKKSNLLYVTKDYQFMD